MTIYFGKGIVSFTTADGQEKQFEAANIRFQPVQPLQGCVVDFDDPNRFAIDVETRLKELRIARFGKGDTLNHPGFSDVEGSQELMNLAMITKLEVDDARAEHVRLQAPKNKPYFRQFEKRGRKR